MILLFQSRDVYQSICSKVQVQLIQIKKNKKLPLKILIVLIKEVFSVGDLQIGHSAETKNPVNLVEIISK